MIKKFIAMIALCLLTTGCVTLFGNARPGQERELNQQSGFREETVITPVAFQSGNKVVVSQEVHKIKESNESKESKVKTPRLTFMQRLGNWLGNLSIFGIIGLIIAIITTHGGALIGLVKWGLKFKKALKETATAIKEAKAVENNNVLEQALKEKQSTETKQLIGKMRATL
ncbi:MAG: hypothetical protein HY350_00620 [Candidatus Omnitrophica bacterium]|nr:hypothetical protein [Candidatus Omnitrophota bacterium]